MMRSGSTRSTSSSMISYVLLLSHANDHSCMSVNSRMTKSSPAVFCTFATSAEEYSSSGDQNSVFAPPDLGQNTISTAARRTTATTAAVIASLAFVVISTSFSAIRIQFLPFSCKISHSFPPTFSTIETSNGANSNFLRLPSGSVASNTTAEDEGLRVISTLSPPSFSA